MELNPDSMLPKFVIRVLAAAPNGPPVINENKDVNGVSAVERMFTTTPAWLAECKLMNGIRNTLVCRRMRNVLLHPSPFRLSISLPVEPSVM